MSARWSLLHPVILKGALGELQCESPFGRHDNGQPFVRFDEVALKNLGQAGVELTLRWRGMDLSSIALPAATAGSTAQATGLAGTINFDLR